MKISVKQYANTLYELTENKSDAEIDDIVMKFIAYMKKAGDMRKVRDVINRFEDVYNNNRNIVEASVTSVRKLDEQELENIQLFIKTKYNVQSVVIKNIINKEIKGGIVIRVGDDILDGSIASRINKLKISLSK